MGLYKTRATGGLKRASFTTFIEHILHSIPQGSFSS